MTKQLKIDIAIGIILTAALCFALGFYAAASIADETVKIALEANK